MAGSSQAGSAVGSMIGSPVYSSHLGAGQEDPASGVEDVLDDVVEDVAVGGGVVTGAFVAVYVGAGAVSDVVAVGAGVSSSYGAGADAPEPQALAPPSAEKRMTVSAPRQIIPASVFDFIGRLLQGDGQ
jgi:hypothetical protein